MKQYLVGGQAAALLTPPASAGCLYGGWMAASRCDRPVQPDGTWQRCVVFNSTYNGLPGTASNYGGLDHRCDVMGPDLHPLGCRLQ
jgi:hypothetical protein